MQLAATKPNDELWKGLVENLSFDLFDEEEIENIIKDIDSFDLRFRQKTLALCHCLSKTRSGFVPNVIERIKTASKTLSPKEMEGWITHAFDLLESRGLDSFFRFVLHIDEETLNQFKSLEGLQLQTISSLLETYIRGISGMELKIVANEEPYTDTDTVYLPPSINQFKDYEKNFLYYKLMTVHCWAQIVWDTLAPNPEDIKTFLYRECITKPDINDFFRLFDNKNLAIDLYNILTAFRLESFLQTELRGLMREAKPLKEDLIIERPTLQSLPEKTAFVEGLYQYFLTGRLKGRSPELLSRFFPVINELRDADSSYKILQIHWDIYNYVKDLQGNYKSNTFQYLGTIKPEIVSSYLKNKYEKQKNRLESVISKIINMPDIEIETYLQKTSGKKPPIRMIPQKDTKYLLVKGKLFELDEETRDMIQEIGIVSDGILLDGNSMHEGNTIIVLKEFMEEETIVETNGGIKYDEWDFLRSDYKKEWCSLFEQDINPGDEPFVELTLKRYEGYVKTLRRKFELLKKELKILRRQKDGEDIDIDATVEAISDMKAGISPKQNLFVRLDRQTRNIAALFLLDMSGSTKGWVNKAEKEALVLMCEALEALGDRYAIYGFSGVTKNRCEFYKIKGFEESYGSLTKKRIAGILPKDYTRMGPPIRHSTNILKTLDAKTKLLITLSDGHPEDRTGYSGKYGIEDTRKALIESKEKGIQPFCITIDQEARSYIPYMFGEVSYIVLDDVRKLPNKITEIYRKLTT